MDESKRYDSVEDMFAAVQSRRKARSSEGFDGAINAHDQAMRIKKAKSLVYELRSACRRDCGAGATNETHREATTAETRLLIAIDGIYS